MLARFALLLSLALFGAAGLEAQSSTKVVSNCSVGFTLTAAGQVQQFNNLTTSTSGGCLDWQIVYFVDGFSAISLLVQSAQDNAGVPGTWGAFGGTIISGVNPNTNAGSNTTRMVGYFPWMRVQLTTVTGTGTVRGLLFGTPSLGNDLSITGGCVGTVGTPCIVAGPTASGSPPANPPVLTAGFDGTNEQTIKTDINGSPVPANATSAQTDGVSNTSRSPTGAGGAPMYYRSLLYQFNGATSDRIFSCTGLIEINDSASGDTQIIAASGSTVVRLCSVSLTAASSVNIRFTQGTGSNCGTSNAHLGGLYQNVTAIALDFESSQASLNSAAGNAVCLNLSTAVNVTGTIIYAQF